MTRQVSLRVNDAPVSLDYFVQSFLDHTVSGMLETLEGTKPVKSLELTIEGDKLTINLNKSIIPVNPFVTKIVRSTILGMVSSLKGVPGVERLALYIER